MERLEERCVLSVATVNTALDVVDLSDGVTSLREAVFFSNALIGPDSIQFDAALNGQTIVLTQGELVISDELAINGPGAGLLTIDASGSDLTPDNNNADGARVFSINDNTGSLINVSILGLTLTGGDAAGDGGAILNNESLSITDSVLTANAAAAGGGAIRSNGFLTIATSTISDNKASHGGGVYASDGTLFINDSTFSGNSATFQGGGLFDANNAFFISNSTFSGNSATVSGGGIYTVQSGISRIAFSTITANTANVGGGIESDLFSTNTSINHTIVAGNQDVSGGNSDIGGLVTASFSLVGVDTGASIINQSGNQIGTAGSPIDPLLAPLADNGGPNLTHALLVGSPAIDAGQPGLLPGIGGTPSYDQRGFPFSRVQNGKTTGAQIDLGAYEVQSGSITGQKWSDLDGDGVKDFDEPGLPGWTIYIDVNRNGVLDGLSGGSAVVEPDNYPPGMILNTVVPGVTLTTTSSGSVYAAPGSGGYESTGSLAFTPSSSGGTWGSLGLRANFATPTSTVSLDLISNDSSDGGQLQAYSSTGVLLASYTTALMPAGVFETMTINRPTADIAYVIATGTGGNTVNLDHLRFGSVATEPSTITDAGGYYTFLELPPGEHVVAELAQPGWIQTFPTTANIHQVLNDLSLNHAAVSALVPNRFDFTDGATGTKIDDGGSDMFDGGNMLNTNLASQLPYTNGVILPSDAAFGAGSRYFTAKYPGLFVLGATGISIEEFSTTGNTGADGAGNVDGAILSTTVNLRQYTLFVKRTYNAGDPSINKVIVVPGDGAGIGVSFPVADSDNDRFQISGLSSASELYYFLVSSQSGGYISDADIVSIANSFLSNIQPVSSTHLVDLDEGQQIAGIDFGNFPPPASIHGAKWNDVNANGSREIDELPLQGWTIFLDEDFDGVLDAGEASTTTDINGNYSFTGLRAGFYRVAEVLQPNWEPTFPYGGSYSLTIGPGQDLFSIDFGNRLIPGWITGQKWNDVDGDGLKESGEAGLSGWLIYIDQDNDGVYSSETELATTTDANGNYWFTIAPGEYVLREVPQPGWTQTFAPGPVTVSAGLGTVDVDFGNQALPGSIQGQKWSDWDRDGVKDAGEPVLQGWTIFLDANNNSVLDPGEVSTTTDAGGNYSFTGLTPGFHVVAEVQQPGWEQTYPLSGGGSVAVFDDPLFVDSSNANYSESDNVQASLASLGFSVATFVGVTGAAWSAALAGAGAVLIPEQEMRELSSALETAAVTALRDYVAGGGGLIIHGSGISATLLNTVFGFGVSEAGAGTATKTAAAAGTHFDDDVFSLLSNNATFGLSPFTLPPGALAIYDAGGAAPVALLSYGSGQIVYLGWDWFDAAPVGSQDSGWLQVLESAVAEVSSSGVAGSHHVLVGPGQDLTNINFGNHLLPNLELAATDFAVSPSNLYFAGQATVNFGVENLGAQLAGPSDVQFYLSDDPVIDPSTDTLLTLWPGDPNYDPAEPEAFHLPPLPYQANFAGSVTLLTPATDPFGTDNDYYIGMFVDADGDVSEDVESNNLNLGQDVDLDGVHYTSNIAQTPFYEDWESTSFDPWWEVIPGPGGRIQITSLNGPFQGANHVTMDTAGSSSTLNQLILHVNLLGKSGVTLHFANREFGDEDNPLDVVEISVDGGATWVTIVSLTGINSTTTYTPRSYDLDLLGLTYSSDTRIRFQQFDNLSIPTDGMAFDDIRVEAVAASLSGDYTRDGSVDAADYVVWRKFLGTVVTPAYAGADGNGNMLIEDGDEAVWRSQYGLAAAPAGSPTAGGTEQAFAAFAVAAVEEPRGAAAAESLADGSGLHSTIQVSGVLFQQRTDGSRRASYRHSSPATALAPDRVDIALRTWLLQSQEHGASEGDVGESELCDRAGASDAYFESFETALADVLASERRPLSRDVARRLAAHR